MNLYDELYEILENYMLGRLEQYNVLMELSDKTFVAAKSYYPAVKLGIYRAVDELGGIPDSLIVEFSEITPNSNITNLEDIVTEICNYMTKNNLTISQVLVNPVSDHDEFEEGSEYTYYESIKTDRFNMLYEELKAEYSK